MRCIMFLLIFCIFAQESKAGKTQGREDEGRSLPSTTSRTTPRSASVVAAEEARVVAFYKKLQKASEVEASLFPLLLKEFEGLGGAEKDWEGVARAQQISRWPHQGNSWKRVVGAQWFFNVAFHKRDQELVSSAFQRCLSLPCESGKKDHLQLGYGSATQVVHSLMKKHPRMRQETSLFALAAAAARLQHPLARCLLMEALRCYRDDDEEKTFFNQNHELAKLGLFTEGGRQILLHIFRATIYADVGKETSEDDGPSLNLCEKQKIFNDVRRFLAPGTSHSLRRVW